MRHTAGGDGPRGACGVACSSLAPWFCVAVCRAEEWSWGTKPPIPHRLQKGCACFRSIGVWTAPELLPPPPPA